MFLPIILFDLFLTFFSSSFYISQTFFEDTKNLLKFWWTLICCIFKLNFNIECKFWIDIRQSISISFSFLVPSDTTKLQIEIDREKSDRNVVFLKNPINHGWIRAFIIRNRWKKFNLQYKKAFLFRVCKFQRLILKFKILVTKQIVHMY